MKLIRKRIQLILILMLCTYSSVKAQIKYPTTQKTGQVDNYFGTKVADPYRWLEDVNSEETKNWVAEQDTVTQDYLGKIPFRNKIKAHLDSMRNYDRYGKYFRVGDYYYFYKNAGPENQQILYRQFGLTGVPEVFIDPTVMSSDGTVVPDVPVFTKSAKYCAYLVSKNGSDWKEARVMNVQTRQYLSDTLKWIKFSEISWRGDEGFYYSGYAKPDSSTALIQQVLGQALYFHKLGTPQSKDVLIYGSRKDSKENVSMQGHMTADERFLIVYVTENDVGHVWIKDVQNKRDFVLLPVYGKVIDADGDKLIVKTSQENGSVISVDPYDASSVEYIIPCGLNRLEDVSSGGGKLFLTYLVDGANEIFQYDYNGNFERKIAIPGYGTAIGFDAPKEDTLLFYAFNSFICPRRIYQYSILTGESKLIKKPNLSINTDDYETVITFFPSTDSAKVPMYVTYKKGLKLDGNNPVLIYVYGGNGISLGTPFSIFNSFFLEQGGVYVQVNARGGGEYVGWHAAGQLENKQHTFDDIYNAVKFLTDKKVTNPQRIALRGASNGGMVVGACITQHPELFKVAIPEVGVMDMLRFQLFTIGWRWIPEYGVSTDKRQFKYLYKYSPLQNLKDSTVYPATLVTTGDHDDRVVPSHSYKFTARLQECNSGNNPTLIRVETNAGHGGRDIIDEETDIWSFVMYNLGMDYKE